MDPLTALPSQIQSGDSYDIRLTLPEYPASAGWALALTLLGAVKATANSEADGDVHVFGLSAEWTRQCPAGTYRKLLRASLDSSERTIESGSIEVLPNYAAMGPGEGMSWEERTLVVVEAALNNTISGEMKMYMIGGRQVMTLSVAELTKLRGELRAAVQMQRGHGFGVPVRFDVVGLR